LKDILKAYRLLDKSERRNAWFVFMTAALVAIFESFSALSVMPFLTVLADPGIIARNSTLAWVNGALGFTDPFDFQIFLGGASFALLILSAVVRSIGAFVMNSFAQRQNYTIGSRLLETYLRRPYAHFLTRTTSDIGKEFLQEISLLVMQVYVPIATIVAQGCTLLVLVVLLIVVNPLTALVGVLVLGGCYGLIYAVVQPRLARLGVERERVDKIRFTAAMDAISGIKILKLLGREKPYLSRFRTGAAAFARVQATSASLSQVPRYGVEAVAFGGIILLAMSLMLQHRGDGTSALSQILPLLGFYAFAGYRILPAMQGIYQSLATIRYGVQALETVCKGLEGGEALPPLLEAPVKPLPFARSVEIEALTFQHPGAPAPAISDLSLAIPAGSTLGIVGPTGAGKTTFVDLFLGLLAPSSGGMRVDGTAVTPANLRNWQADLGYVPQEVFLVDASISANIAIGLPPEQIDQAQVERAARMAQIHDFVTSDLPQGYATTVGERGVRLSGGQRQRIGIARALYNDPGLIVFDEATSALDNLTEQEVVRAIAALTGQKTLIIIAHRLSTVQNCDQILVLERGRKVGLGTYEELLASNPTFQRIANARQVA
jgi:ABC-type multidrug transport system fused ATPase/permease subunit